MTPLVTLSNPSSAVFTEDFTQHMLVIGRVFVFCADTSFQLVGVFFSLSRRVSPPYPLMTKVFFHCVRRGRRGLTLYFPVGTFLQFMVFFHVYTPSTLPPTRSRPDDRKQHLPVSVRKVFVLDSSLLFRSPAFSPKDW